MIPRALTKEHITFVASSAFGSLRRLMSPSEEVPYDLASQNRALEEYCRGRSVVHEHALAWGKLLYDELDATLSATEEGDGSSGSGSNCGGTAISSPTESKRRPASESTIIAALQVARHLYRVHSSCAVSVMTETSLVRKLVEVISARDSYPRRIIEVVAVLLVDLLPHSSSLAQEAAESLVKGVSSSSMAIKLRVQLILFHVLRKGDLLDVSRTHELRGYLAQYGIMDQLLQGLASCWRSAEAGQDKPVALLAGTLALLLLGGLARSNVPHKEELRKRPEVFQYWTYFSSSLANMDYSYLGGLLGHLYEPDPAWAGELVEMLVELCTGDSWCLRRQQCCELTMADSNNVRDDVNASRKWESLPNNWDRLPSETSFIWRISAATYSCTLTRANAELLLSALAELDAEGAPTDYIFRGVISCLIILCRANPDNAIALAEADLFSCIVSMMIGDNSAFLFTRPSPRARVRLNHPNWTCCLALTTVLLHTHVRAEDWNVLRGALDNMLTVATSEEDCEIIEHCLHVLKERQYPGGTVLWMSSDNACLHTTIEKPTSRWSGYSLTVWICPLCVWSTGSHILSISDNFGVSYCLYVVANGQRRCLALSSKTEKDNGSVVNVLPDSTLADGWNHITITHYYNTTIYVNGARAGLLSPTYPRGVLQICMGGEGKISGEGGVRSFFGQMTLPEIHEPYLNDRDIEKMYAAGIGNSLDLPTSTRLFTVDPALGFGPGNKSPAPPYTVNEVSYHNTVPLPDLLKEQDALAWCHTLLEQSVDSPSRASLVFLGMEVLSLYARIVSTGLQDIASHGIIELLGGVLLAWNYYPQQLAHVLLNIVLEAGSGNRSAADMNSVVLASHPVSAQALGVVLDICSQPHCAVLTRNAIFRELCGLLQQPSNLAFFKTGNNVDRLLALASQLAQESVMDYVNLIEKLVKDSTEMLKVFRLLRFEPTDSNSTMNVLKCEVLRMLYDISKSDENVVTRIIDCDGMTLLLLLLGSEENHSEILRVYIIRLIALIVCQRKKERDYFFSRPSSRISSLGKGLDVFTIALLNHSHYAPVQVITFNAILKFALNYFQPNKVDKALAVLKKLVPPQKRKDEANATKDESPIAMSGHLPSIIPAAEHRRTVSHDLTSMQSDCSDLEQRLHIDDRYTTSHTESGDVLEYPELLKPIFYLLAELIAKHTAQARSLKQHQGEATSNAANNASSSNTDEASANTLTSDSHSDQSSRREEAPIVVVECVLSFIDVMLDATGNAAALIGYDWIEWLWSVVGPVLMDAEGLFDSPWRQQLEALTRSIIRKLAITDIFAKSSTIKSIQKLVDLPLLQQLAIEEVFHYFTTHSCFDEHRIPVGAQLSAASPSSNVIKNLDALLYNLDDYLYPLPRSIVLRLVKVVDAFIINNTNSIRTKLNKTRIFETRDRLCFFLLSSLSLSQTRKTFVPAAAFGSSLRLLSLSSSGNVPPQGAPEHVSSSSMANVQVAAGISSSNGSTSGAVSSVSNVNNAGTMANNLSTPNTPVGTFPNTRPEEEPLFMAEPYESLLSLVQLNYNDPNTSILILKMLIGACFYQNFARVGVFIKLLIHLSNSSDQRRVIEKIVADNDAINLMLCLNGPTAKQPGHQDPNENLSAPNEQDAEREASAPPGAAEALLSWAHGHEARWDAVIQRVIKHCKNIESDYTTRAEKRERSFSSKQKARQEEILKRLQALNKQRAEWIKLNKEFYIESGVSQKDNNADSISQGKRSSSSNSNPSSNINSSNNAHLAEGSSDASNAP